MKQQKKGLLKYFTWKKWIFFFVVLLIIGLLPDIINGKSVTTSILLKDIFIALIGGLLFTIVNAGHR